MSLSQQLGLIFDYTCEFTSRRSSFSKEDAGKVCPDEEDIFGKVVIVTGSNTGIGKTIALQMAKRGAVVIMAVRNLEKGQDAMQDIKKLIAHQDQNGRVTMEVMLLDLGDLKCVGDFVKEFQAKYDRLDILVNNAGCADPSGSLRKTKDGFEQHIGVNHLGPFLLTRLLLTSLIKGAPSRIVCLTSMNIQLASVDKEDDDMWMEKKVKTGSFGWEPYALSKLLNAVCIRMFARSLDKNLGVKVFQLCPGIVATDLRRNERSWSLSALANRSLFAIVGLTPYQGCETAVYCAVAKSLAENDNCGRGELCRFKGIWRKGDQIVRESAEQDQARSWYQRSEALVGLSKKS